MALFADRRTNVIHDIGMNAAPDHDPAAGLHGWASAHADARQGLAATVMPAAIAHGSPNVLPGQMNAPRVPASPARPTDFASNITSPAQQRASVRPMGVASRTASWSNGSGMASQSILPGTPMYGKASQTVLPASRRPMAGVGGFLGQSLRAGASFAQKTRRR